MTEDPDRLCAVLACYNRRRLTVASLARFEVCAARAGVPPFAVLVDDGSSDGTADEVAKTFAWVRIVRNEGAPLFWARAMHQGMVEAMGQGFRRLMLLNDDTALDPDAVSTLLACEASVRARSGGPVLIVGSTRGSAGDGPTYGGERRVSKWRPTSFRRVEPRDEAIPVDTLNGNIVLIPPDALHRVGPIDPEFEHAMGDIDLGLRAHAVGVTVWLAPGTLGVCDPNPVSGTAADRSLPPLVRWRLMLGRKGLPWRSWLHFTRRHAGPAWVLYFAWPYLKLVGLSFADWVIRRLARSS